MFDDQDLKRAASQNAHEILPPYDKIFEAAGYEGLKAFLEAFGGGAVYVPTLRTVLSKCIESEARKELGRNFPISRIARRYGYSARHLRKVLDRAF